ncbi:MAG: 50S ribosomal protein L21 [Candidatus Andersenbacteria bacterium]
MMGHKLIISTMAHAVIKTGSKQYVVTDGTRIKVEKLPTAAGKKVTFNEVLLVATEKSVALGKPTVKGAKVEGTVILHGRRPKVTGVKMKAKKRYKKYFGHKQHFTEVEITKISAK